MGIQWASTSIDFLTHLPKTPTTQHDAIMVVVCRLSKQAIFVPCSSKITAEQAAQLYIKHVFNRGYGLAESIISDRDSLFTSDYWLAFHRAIETTLKMTTAYHPQADGQTEVVNRTLLSYPDSTPLRFTQTGGMAHPCRVLL